MSALPEPVACRSGPVVLHLLARPIGLSDDHPSGREGLHEGA